jgi:acyl-CoA reductase-like NAD-dependent aldehyde dehydrogenase
VHESIYDKFKSAMVKFAEAYVVGDGSLQTTTHGPVQNLMQYEYVKTFFDDIEKQDWKVATGGKIEPSTGYFIQPTIIDRPPDDSRIVVDEPFGKCTSFTWITPCLPVAGPIVPLLSWSEEKEVIARANNTATGLGASVWAKDLDKASEVAKQMRAGTVWINSHFDLSPMATFGGHKESGIGSEWGLDGMKAQCNAQTLFFNKNPI